MKTRIYTLVILSIILMVFSAENTDAAINQITVSPTINYITLDPGNNIQKNLTVKNNSNEEINVEAYIQKFSPSGTKGEINFSSLNDSSLMSFADSETTSQTIKPNSTLEIPINIQTSNNLTPGGYYYSVIVKENFKGSDVSVTPNIAALYFIKVNGNLFKTTKIESFDIDHIAIGNISVIISKDAKVSTTIKNTGNIHIEPDITLSENSLEGKTFAYPKHTLIPGESLTLYTIASINQPLFWGNYSFTEKVINENKLLDSNTRSYYVLNIQHILYVISGISLLIALTIGIYLVFHKRPRYSKFSF